MKDFTGNKKFKFNWEAVINRLPINSDLILPRYVAFHIGSAITPQNLRGLLHFRRVSLNDSQNISLGNLLFVSAA